MEDLSEPRVLQAPLPAPWGSPQVFLSPHLDFWAPWDPPHDFPCAPVPLSGLQSISWGPGLASHPTRREEAGDGSWVGSPSSPHGPHGRRGPHCHLDAGAGPEAEVWGPELLCTTLMRVTRVRQKAGREERKERRKGRGKTGERRAGTRSAEGHTPCWESSRGEPGVLKQEAGAGVSLAPSLQREAQGSKRNPLEGPAHVTSSHKITSLCQHNCSTPLVLLQQRHKGWGGGSGVLELQNQLFCI